MTQKIMSKFIKLDTDDFRYVYVNIDQITYVIASLRRVYLSYKTDSVQSSYITITQGSMEKLLKILWENEYETNNKD